MSRVRTSSPAPLHTIPRYEDAGRSLARHLAIKVADPVDRQLGVTLATDKVSGDDITPAYTGATFLDKNVGPGKTVNVSGISISGTDLGNYHLLNTTAVTTAAITARDLTVSATGVDKVYNGLLGATVTLATDKVSGDDITPAYTGATFLDKNVGPGKTVNVSGISISGTDLGNYHLLNTTAVTTAAITRRPLIVTAAANVKTADGDVTAATVPTVSDLTTFGTGGDSLTGLSETYDNLHAGIGKTLKPAGKVTDGFNGNNYSYTYVSQNNGAIRPAAVSSLVFTAQPIDTQVSTATVSSPIYSACLPPPTGSTSPCAPTPTSAPVQVTAYDQFGNLAGPGTLGADAGTAPVYITIKDGASPPATLEASVPTSGGVVSFVDATPLKITTLETTKLYATATQAATLSVPAGSTNQPSRQIRIVLQVAACPASTNCSLTAKDVFSPKPGTQLSENAYGQIVGQSNLYAGTSTNVLLTTNFLPGNSVDGQCKTTSPSGTNSTIGTAVELRLTGVGITNPKPTSTMLIILPMKTLQYYGVSSRNASAFNVCLGSFNLSSPTTSSTPWMSVNPKGGLMIAHGVDTTSDPDGLYRYWGVPAACGTKGLNSNPLIPDPCIAMKTKSSTDVLTQINKTAQPKWTAADVAKIFTDGDIAIFITKPFPWDSKGGGY